MTTMNEIKIAVLIPCYNEEKTITKVVEDFKKQLPEARIIVYDNNSIDETVSYARKAGATVLAEPRQGKGFVIKRMFQDIDSDIYIMVDGDDTYAAENVHDLIRLVKDGADIAVGDRISKGEYFAENTRKFHNFGNLLVRGLINRLFHVQLKDIMSGYRAFSNDFVKNYPVLCDGFQVETDMTIFALDHGFSIKETPAGYNDRPEGSDSKLRTIPDGFKVILTIFNLYRYYKPLIFFGFISILFLLSGLLVGIPVILEYVINTYIHKIPSAILASGLMLLSVLFMSIGIMLDAVRRIGREQFELRRK